jgi:hypothetical protein
MEPITRENYFRRKQYLSYHDIRNFLKCEYLYSEDKSGKVARIPRDYFLYGSAFDSLLTGEFTDRFIIGKDPKKGIEQIRKYRLKAEESKAKYEGKTDKRSQEYLGKALRMIEELQVKENELLESGDKEAITETLYAHLESSIKEMERQTLMERFPRTPETNQVIITTQISGKEVKSMLDYLHKGNKIIVDYKTTASMKNFNPRMYRDQLAWYRMVVREKFGIECECYLAVVDKDTYSKHAYFYQFAPETLDEAEPELLAAVERIKEAEELGIYEPAAFENIRGCFECDHYSNCPFTIQSEPEIV